MLLPKLAAVLAVVGVVCLLLSAVLGATSIADWVLDAAQAFLLLGTLFLLPVIVAYTAWSYWVFRGKVRAGAGYH